MKPFVSASVVCAAIFATIPSAHGQAPKIERAPVNVSGIPSPTTRVSGTVGQLSVLRKECRTLPMADARRRIVDASVQEWAFFGFRMLAPGADDFEFEPGEPSRDFSDSDSAEAVRVAPSIAGYWATTTGGPGIVSNQNQAWNGPRGITSRWVAPWSAAFISWVMCESGLGVAFQRAIAHHVYIDQAIRARDGGERNAAYVAYDPGEMEIQPGDLLCASRRPAYRNLAELAAPFGEGARTHCDVVVRVDEARGQISAIGGNVRRAVTMKVFPAVREKGKHLRPSPPLDTERPRPIFAHLALRANRVNADALTTSPVLKVVCDSVPVDSKVCVTPTSGRLN
jgi:hypothetical protein